VIKLLSYTYIIQ